MTQTQACAAMRLSIVAVLSAAGVDHRGATTRESLRRHVRYYEARCKGT